MLHILTNHLITLDPCFSRPQVPFIELDMGCGKGGFTLQLAERFPDRLILANDVMLGRLRRLNRKVEKKQLQNIELLRADSLELADRQMPPACVNRLHLLCPDPWPKQRHRHKRLINAEFLARVFKILKPEGVFHFCTDDTDYLKSVEKLLQQLGWFEEWPPGISDIKGLQTDFEKQWRKMRRKVSHLSYRRNRHGRETFSRWV